MNLLALLAGIAVWAVLLLPNVSASAIAVSPGSLAWRPGETESALAIYNPDNRAREVHLQYDPEAVDIRNSTLTLGAGEEAEVKVRRTGSKESAILVGSGAAAISVTVAGEKELQQKAGSWWPMAGIGVAVVALLALFLRA